MNLAQTGFFVLGSHKSLHETYWTRLWDLLKGILLYGTVNWRRASDGLKPPRLSPQERRVATPPKNLEVIKPRENPQAAIIKALPKKALPPKAWDVTAGAIVSDPLPSQNAPPTPPVPPAPFKRLHAPPVSAPVPAATGDDETAAGSDEPVVVHRRRRHHRHGLQARRAPRSAVHFGNSPKPGLLARWFGTR